MASPIRAAGLGGLVGIATGDTQRAGNTLGLAISARSLAMRLMLLR
jgi:hypothetical protein